MLRTANGSYIRPSGERACQGNFLHKETVVGGYGRHPDTRAETRFSNLRGSVRDFGQRDTNHKRQITG